MAKIKVKSKKNLLDTDNPLTLWMTARQYVEQNVRQIGAIALAVVVVAGAIFAWTVVRSRAERESTTMLNGAMATMSAAVDAQSGAIRPAMYEQALGLFKQLRQKHGATQSGKIALLYAGNCAYNIKKYDEAMSLYREFLDAAGGDLRFLRPAALEGMGYACEGKGDYKAAVEWYEKQKKESGEAGSAVMNLARALELAGDRGKACSQYREFIENNPLSGQKQLAQLKVQAVCRGDD